MQYSVPQFIDVENKILGPISVRQFIEVAITIAVLFITYKLADLGLFIIIAIFIVLGTVVIAFVKINGRPFHYFALNLIQTTKAPNLRVWKKEGQPIYKKPQAKKKEKDKKAPVHVNYVKVTKEKEKTHSRLSNLSLLVDTGGYYEQKKTGVK